MYEDDPIAEEYDKYGRYYPISNSTTLQSSLAFVTDYQRRMATKIVHQWNLKKNKPNKIDEMIMRWNAQESL
ncbi:hypothetical protein [uncultured Mediterranean phage uvMED]|nr:hypothetical protein [uncultured Mediterranean phage uvMED]BAQ87254.1 hypothetical protein [uncultured Mediterranean phage uvMED]BAQ87325.1 hypothetical protein [uncultured Mediterranean phage uvMED]BAQ87345.1 hypothetical protein [uncultured Mediterranean phage uvMED]BAR16702.1 hypothetical protein [uncultured Mediterranean phage uvMED]